MFAFPQRSSHTTVQHGDSDCPKWPHVGKPRLPTRVCVLCVLYELYVYVYVCACDMYVNNIYIHSTVYIYIYYMYMDGHVYSTYMFMYLSMHACVANYNKCISDYSCCGKEPPILQHPFLLLPLKAQPGRSTDWINQQKWGAKPNFRKIGYYWFRNWCDVPPFVVRLLSVQKINIIWRVRKIAAFFLTNHVFLGCYGFVLGLSWACPF